MADLARRRAEQREFVQKRQTLLQTSNGFDAIKMYMGKMIEELCRLREEYTATDPKQVIRMDGTTGAYSITDKIVIGLGIKWLRDGSPSISHDKLEVTEYLNCLQLPGEGLMTYFGNPTNEPRRGLVARYKAEIGPGLHFGWVLSGSFDTHDRLADTLFQQFLALSENRANARSAIREGAPIQRAIYVCCCGPHRNHDGSRRRLPSLRLLSAPGC